MSKKGRNLGILGIVLGIGSAAAGFAGLYANHKEREAELELEAETALHDWYHDEDEEE